MAVKKYINSIGKRITIVGETHVKNEQDSVVCHSILQQFVAIGYENVKKTWFDKHIKPYTLMNYLERKLNKYRYGDYGSSVDFSSISNQINAIINTIDTNNTNDTEFSKDLKAKLANTVIIEAANHKYCIDLSKIHEYAEYDLEQNYKFSAIDHFRSVHTSIQEISLIGVIATFPFKSLSRANSILASISIFTSIGGIIGSLVLKKYHFQNYPIMQWIFPDTYAYLIKRNEVMVKNGLKMLDHHDNVAWIVGQGHIAGIDYLLVNKYGFRSEN